jgi:hypothetical protein
MADDLERQASSAPPEPLPSRLPDQVDGDPGRPSLFTQAAYGAAAGLLLGMVDGALLHYITDVATPHEATLWGGAAGSAAGPVIVVLGRAVRGPSAITSLGTVLGLLYGIVPGLAVLYQSIFVNRVVGKWNLAGLVMASSMLGLLVGGVLDRCFDAAVTFDRPSKDDGD